MKAKSTPKAEADPSGICNTTKLELMLTTTFKEQEFVESLGFPADPQKIVELLREKYQPRSTAGTESPQHTR